MFLLGTLTGVSFFVLLGLCIYLGYKIGQNGTKKAPQPDDETLRKQRRLHEDFQKLMNYDLDTALRRKDVSE